MRSFIRSLLLPFVALLALGLPTLAQDTSPVAPAEPAVPMEMPWQDVITSQIQAFRDHDAPAAFSYAGSGFQTGYPSAEAFFAAIIGSGYAPIMESVSHSFGEFQMVGETGVIQQVRLVGKDQEFYGAFYQLTREETGWRVQGVQLFREQGIAI